MRRYPNEYRAKWEFGGQAKPAELYAPEGL